jgi:glycosyltransferase involved in cell wall biosynthesis
MARINLLLNNPFLTDSRSWKIARSSAQAGHAVTVLARGGDGLPDREEREGFTVLRLTPPVRLAWLPAPTLTSGDTGTGRGGLVRRARSAVRESVGRVAQVARYLLAARSWAGAWSGVAPPADIWQSEGLVTLPVTLELARRHGGRVVYDSRDVHVESGRFARLPGPWRRLLRVRERSWVRRCDALVTVSEPYADVLERTLRRRPDAIVMNCPPLWIPPDPPPRILHEELGLDAGQRIVLYLGQVAPGRGVEQLVEAIGRVERAVLVVAGWGSSYDAVREAAGSGPAADRVRFMPGVARLGDARPRDDAQPPAQHADEAVRCHRGGHAGRRQQPAGDGPDRRGDRLRGVVRSHRSRGHRPRHPEHRRCVGRAPPRIP